MAKIVKRKKRRLRIEGLAKLLLSIAIIAWVSTSLFVNTKNAELTVKIQKMNEELASLAQENQSLSFEIQTLESKDRIYEVAQTANMDQIQDNIISIIGE